MQDKHLSINDKLDQSISNGDLRQQYFIQRGMYHEQGLEQNPLPGLYSICTCSHCGEQFKQEIHSVGLLYMHSELEPLICDTCWELPDVERTYSYL